MTIETLQAEVAQFNSQAAALLGTINGQKEVLIQRVAAATAQADRAQGQADQVNAGVGAAAGAAAQALAIYGTTAAMQAKLDEAKALANAAQTAAASASSVLQQDLSAISAALHRSPNAITAMCIYDLSKDSDGGSWCDRMEHTSWMNEPLNGAWRGAVASEAACRAISGAATGDYFQLTTDGKFYKLNAGAGITEVFRGNRAKFPRLAAIVAEAGNVTIYDLTQPGRPMWMRLVATSVMNWYGSSGLITTLAAVQGVLVVGTSSSGTRHAIFVADKFQITHNSSLTSPSGGIAGRHSPSVWQAGSVFTIPSNTVNAVAMTVLPDAPFDVATGLQVPTIAVATAGGMSVIRHDGVVTNNFPYSVTGVSFDGRGNAVQIGENSRNYKKIIAPLYTAFSVATFGPLNLGASSQLQTSVLHKATKALSMVYCGGAKCGLRAGQRQHPCKLPICESDGYLRDRLPNR
jgi:hypothetical protein